MAVRRKTRAENIPNHDVEQNDGGNNATFDVVIDGEGEDHRNNEDLCMVSYRDGCTAGEGSRSTYKSQAV